MTALRNVLHLSNHDRARVERVEHLARAGDSGLDELMGLLVDPSWAVRRAVVGALAALGESAVAPLIDVLRERRDNEVRLAAAVDALVASRAESVNEAMVRLAESKVIPPVICDAVQVLGRRRARRAVALLATLSKHQDDNVAVAALEALGRVGGPETVDPLVEAATSSSFFRTFPAIDALGRTGDARAVAPIAARVADPLYATEALRALGHTGQLAALKPLAAVFGTGSDSLVRAAAVALADLKERYEARHGNSERFIESLRGSVDAPAVSSRVLSALSGVTGTELVSVIHVLGLLGDPIAIDKMVELAVEEPPIGSAAQDALRRLGTVASRQIIAALRDASSAARQRLLPLLSDCSEGLDELLACLRDDEPEVRCRACEALARAGETRSVQAVFALLGDPDPRVGQAATAAIHALGSLDSKRLALERARSADRAVRRAALRILAYFGYPEGLAALLDAVRDDDEAIREAAVTGLAHFEKPEAQAALHAATVHPSPKTRSAALRSIGQSVRTPRGEEVLRKATSDSDEWVRYYACQALGRLCIDDAVDVLVERLSDPSGQVRVSAVEALTALRSPRVFAALAAAASSDDPDLQRAAIAGMGRHFRPEALTILRDAVANVAPATRLAALGALNALAAPEVVPILTFATNDPEGAVRSAAIGYLATRLGSDATQALVARAALPDTRDRAMEALAVAGDQRVEHLLAMLESADGEQSGIIAEILVRLHRPSAHAALADALQSSNVHARRATAAALVDVATPEARRALQAAAASDADEAVRRIAATIGT